MSEKHYIKLIVFDMAGTTVNEDNVVYKTLQLAINKLGHNFTLNNVLLNGGGKEKLQAIRDIMKPAYNSSKILEKDAQIAFSDFVIMLKKSYENLTVNTYDGTTELFEFLRKNGVKVALNTGYNTKTARSLLDKLNWSEGQTFDALVTADDVANSRPAPDMILLAMEKCGISNSKEVAKVGDTIVDIKEGKAAECGLTLGVTSGAQTADQLTTADPDFIIDSLLELKQIIRLKD
ncbi:phosphonatase-like hydrolase [Algoriphagus antarcticus]|uniref:Phosphonatase-like hydrolase n=1 Tax=Algoriphagus antarcticus TaxID=238540 RepID=A0A3E0DWS8_9BACT|nr:phosphonatase-like hydrolase [Algoriphagus antarcticus]REG90421.1 phosphonatase-like hydrolase [Algoriphagus antarcticus]